MLNELDDDDDENKAIMREGIDELTTTIADLKARIAEESTDETEREITEADIDSIEDPTTEAKPFPLKQQLTNAEIKLISFTNFIEPGDDDETKTMFRESIEELTTTYTRIYTRVHVYILATCNYIYIHTYTYIYIYIYNNHAEGENVKLM